MAAEPILVWRFRQAPEEYKALSGHGGDEDYLALVPASMAGSYPDLFSAGSWFGRCDVSEHLLPDGRLVLIGAHA